MSPRGVAVLLSLPAVSEGPLVFAELSERSRGLQVLVGWGHRVPPGLFGGCREHRPVGDAAP